MLSTPTAGQFRKAAASSPQQACVMVYRDERRTLIWDDKLADPADTRDTAVPPGQCLSFDHDQFEAIQQAIRAGTPVRRFLMITESTEGRYEFSAAPEYTYSVGATTLYFDHDEYAAFVQAVRHNEFQQTAVTASVT